MGTITGYGSKNSHEFKLTVNETSTSTANNTSEVSFSFTIYKASYSWSNWNSITYSITINGTSYTGTIPSYSAGSTMTIRSGSQTIAHNNDGTKSINYSFSVNDGSGQSYTCGNASASGTLTLTKIPRYTTVYNSLRSKTINTLDINWSTTNAIDWVQYSLNGGGWTDIYGNPDGAYRNGHYQITGLNPNTNYTIKTRCKRTDSQLWSESSAITITTYDIARISALSNFEHGNNASVSITNPASISSLSLVMKIGDTQILSRTVSAGNNSIVFSDTELDNLYKKYGSSSSLTATFILSGSGYTNSRTCTVTLKGNQKTIRNNINSAWKRGKLWINVNGSWKRAVIWSNVNGTWKRGI